MTTPHIRPASGAKATVTMRIHNRRHGNRRFRQGLALKIATRDGVAIIDYVDDETALRLTEVAGREVLFPARTLLAWIASNPAADGGVSELYRDACWALKATDAQIVEGLEVDA